MRFSRGSAAGLILIVFAAAAALRLAGLGYGLPHTFNSDEPHLVNLAVSFGKGSLSPYSFKYPTLWPTVLFAGYGGYFLAWSGFGMMRSAADFAAMFAWDPTGFFAIGRGLSALFSILALVMVWKLEEEHRAKESWLPWGAMLLAFSPVLVELAHAAKPDSMMFFFITAAWYAAYRIQHAPSRKWYWICGAAVGLAISSQYTAGLCGLLIPLAHFLSRRRGQFRWLVEGLLAVPAAFVLGTPYAVLDFPRFHQGIKDFSYLANLWETEQSAVAAQVLLNLWNFAGAGSIAGVCLVAGSVLMLRRDWRLGVMVLVPVVSYTLFMMNHPDGGWGRYLLGCYPGLALLAAEALNGLPRKQPVTALIVLTALGPGFYGSLAYDRGILLPDTRTISEDWIKKNIPEGATMLLDSRHAVPRTAMAREQVEELFAKTTRLGSPRRHYYKAMLHGHPGGGRRIYRIQRSAGDLRLNPRLLKKTQAEVPVLDVREGLKPARSKGVQYVITSSFGVQLRRSPELKPFFNDLRREAMLIKEFPAVPGKVTGPHIRVYSL